MRTPGIALNLLDPEAQIMSLGLGLRLPRYSVPTMLMMPPPLWSGEMLTPAPGFNSGRVNSAAAIQTDSFESRRAAKKKLHVEGAGPLMIQNERCSPHLMHWLKFPSYIWKFIEPFKWSHCCMLPCCCHLPLIRFYRLGYRWPFHPSGSQLEWLHLNVGVHRNSN